MHLYLIDKILCMKSKEVMFPKQYPNQSFINELQPVSYQNFTVLCDGL